MPRQEQTWETSAFPPHVYHGIPIGGHIGDGATLSAGRLWASFQAEAEDLLRIDGRWLADERQRNRRINAAYARRWLADRRFQADARHEQVNVLQRIMVDDTGAAIA